MGKGRTRIGAKKVAKVTSTLGPKRAAKKLGVSEATLRRWKREGVPKARRHDLAKLVKPAKKPPTRARNVKWKDVSGHWRNRSGTFTSPPHRKKGEEPRPRKHAPPPKPPKPPRAPKPPRPHAPQPAPKKKSQFPRTLLEDGGQIRRHANGALFQLPDLKTPAGLRELALKLGKSVATIRGWIQRDHVPVNQRSNLRAIERGSRVYDPAWTKGDRSAWTRSEFSALRAAAEAFKSLRDAGATGTREAYDAWRKLKDQIRSQLTRAAWRKLVLKIGRAIGLADTGDFSSERWTES